MSDGAQTSHTTVPPTFLARLATCSNGGAQCSHHAPPRARDDDRWADATEGITITEGRSLQISFQELLKWLSVLNASEFETRAAFLFDLYDFSERQAPMLAPPAERRPPPTSQGRLCSLVHSSTLRLAVPCLAMQTTLALS